MSDMLSPKQVAMAIGVSEASIKRWCDQGLLRATRTMGGHRRLSRADVIQFLKFDGIPLVQPSVLGLPSMTGSTIEVSIHVASHLTDALAAGDQERARCLVINYFLSGKSAVETFDEVIAPAFHNLGEQWKCDRLDIFEERRGCEIALTILRELESLIPEPVQSMGLAACATLQDDRYQIPLAMVSMALKESGWTVEKLGTHLPGKSLEKAVDILKPKIFCVSVSHISLLDRLRDELRSLHKKIKTVGGTLIVGGQALSDDIRKELFFDVFCDDLKRLESFVKTHKV
ncbi:MAG: helix-turn-helix domain-containing protein [Bdellovibrionales bacterium]|nr:helix-turn-helix domain-containing protein [Bdellovibrionales bacterium]